MDSPSHTRDRQVRANQPTSGSSTWSPLALASVYPHARRHPGVGLGSRACQQRAHLAAAVNGAINVVPTAADPGVHLVHPPVRTDRFAVLASHVATLARSAPTNGRWCSGRPRFGARPATRSPRRSSVGSAHVPLTGSRLRRYRWVGSLVDVLLARFHRYLLEERGLAASTAGAPTLPCVLLRPVDGGSAARVRTPSLLTVTPSVSCSAMRPIGRNKRPCQFDIADAADESLSRGDLKVCGVA